MGYELQWLTGLGEQFSNFGVLKSIIWREQNTIFLTDTASGLFAWIAQEDASSLQTAAQGAQQSFRPHIGRQRSLL